MEVDIDWNIHLSKLEFDEREIQYFINFAEKTLHKHLKETKSILEKAYAIAERNNYSNARAWMILFLAFHNYYISDYSDAVTQFEESYYGFSETGDNKGLLQAFNGLANSYFHLGIYDLALEWSMKGVVLADEIGNARMRAVLLIAMGSTYIKLRHFDEATQFLFQALNSDPTSESIIQVKLELASLRLVKNDAAGALPFAEEACKLAKQENFIVLEASAHLTLGRAYHMIGWSEEAEKSFDESLNLAKNSGDKRINAEIFLFHAKLEFDKGDRSQSTKLMQKALDIAHTLKVRPLEGQIHKEFADIKTEMKHFAEALVHYKEYHSIQDELYNEKNERFLLKMRGEQTKRDTKIYKSMYDQIALISTIGQEITSTLSIQKILEILYERINEIMDVSLFAIALFNEEKKSLCYELVIEKGAHIQLPDIFIDSEDCFENYCFKRKVDVFVSDIDIDYSRYISKLDLRNFTKERQKSLMFCPLISGGSAIGFVTVQSFTRNIYTRQHLDALRALSSYASIALDNARLFTKLNELATTDQLTNLLNRRAIFELGNRQFYGAMRYKHSLSVIMGDIDLFKNVNDKHGHDAGDSVLRRVSYCITSCLRTSDFAGRYGGEEFLIILPDTTEEGAVALAERIRREIGGTPIPLSDDSFITVTTSFGVFSFREDSKDFESGVIAADRALYEAKNSGRDRVRVFHPD